MAEAIGYDGTIKREATPASVGSQTTGGIGPEGVGKIAAAYPDWGETAQNVVNAGRAYLGYKESVATTDHKNAQQVYQGFYSEGAKATLDDFKARMEAGQWTDEQFNDEWDAAEKRLRADAAAKTNTALKGMFFNQDGVYTRDPSFRKSDDRLWALRNASSEAEKRRYLLNYRQQQTAIARTMGLATVGTVAANVEGAATLADEQLSSDPTINEQQKTSLVVGTIDNVYTRDNATYVEQLKSVTGDEFQAQITDRLAVSDRAGVEKLASDATASIKSIGEKQKALVEYAAEQEIAIAEKKAKNGAISQEQLDYFVSNAEKKKAERLTAIETDMRNRAIDLGRIIRSAKIADSKATLEAMNKASKNEKLNEDEAKRVSDAEVKVKNITLETTDTPLDFTGTPFDIDKNKTSTEEIVCAFKTRIRSLDDNDPNFVENGLAELQAAANLLSGNDTTTLQEREKALEDLKAFFLDAATYATAIYGGGAKDKLYAIEQGRGKMTYSQQNKIAQELLHQRIASASGLKLNDKGLLDFGQLFAGKNPMFAQQFGFFVQNNIRSIAEATTPEELNKKLEEVSEKWTNLKGDITMLTNFNTIMAIGGSTAGMRQQLEELARARKAAASKPADSVGANDKKYKQIELDALKGGASVAVASAAAKSEYFRDKYRAETGEELPSSLDVIRHVLPKTSGGALGAMFTGMTTEQKTLTDAGEIYQELSERRIKKEAQEREKNRRESEKKYRQQLLNEARSQFGDKYKEWTTVDIPEPPYVRRVPYLRPIEQLSNDQLERMLEYKKKTPEEKRKAELERELGEAQD